MKTHYSGISLQFWQQPFEQIDLENRLTNIIYWINNVVNLVDETNDMLYHILWLCKRESLASYTSFYRLKEVRWFGVRKK